MRFQRWIRPVELFALILSILVFFWIIFLLEKISGNENTPTPTTTKMIDTVYIEKIDTIYLPDLEPPMHNEQIKSDLRRELENL